MNAIIITICILFASLTGQICSLNHQTVDEASKAKSELEVQSGK